MSITTAGASAFLAARFFWTICETVRANLGTIHKIDSSFDGQILKMNALLERMMPSSTIPAISSIVFIRRRFAEALRVYEIFPCHADLRFGQPWDVQFCPPTASSDWNVLVKNSKQYSSLGISRGRTRLLLYFSKVSASNFFISRCMMRASKGLSSFKFLMLCNISTTALYSVLIWMLLHVIYFAVII